MTPTTGQDRCRSKTNFGLGFGKAKSRFCTIDCDREPADKVQVEEDAVKRGSDGERIRLVRRTIK
jgi:hypothetical protein